MALMLQTSVVGGSDVHHHSYKPNELITNVKSQTKFHSFKIIINKLKTANRRACTTSLKYLLDGKRMKGNFPCVSHPPPYLVTEAGSCLRRADV